MNLLVVILKKNLIYIGFLIIISPFVILSFFCNPQNDDFYESIKLMDIGLIGTQIYDYKNIMGRYTASFFLNLNPLNFDWYFGYKIIPIFIIFLLLSVIWGLITRIFSHEEFKTKFTIAACLFILNLSFMPSIPHGIYWMVGSITYTLGNIIFILIITKLYDLFIRKETTLINKLKTCILIFLMVGTNEISMVILMFFLLILSYYLYKTKSYRKTVWIFLIVLFLSILLEVSAPSNYSRSLTYTNNHSFYNSIILSISYTIQDLLKWFVQTPLLPLSLLYIPVGIKITHLRQNNLFSLHPALSIALIFLIIICSYFPHFWATGQEHPDRISNIVYFTFTLGWFYIFQVLITYFKNYFSELSMPLFFKYSLIVYSFFFLLSPFSKVRMAYSDIIKGTAYNHNKELITRHHYLKLSNCQDCIVPDIKTKCPASFYFWDMNENPNYGVNISVSKYYKKKSIRIRKGN